MTQLKAVDVNGKQYIDSRDIADYLGRKHTEVLKAIRKIEEDLKHDPFVAATEKVDFSDHFKIRSVHYRNLEWPYYLITERGCELYSTKLQKKSVRWSFYLKVHETLNTKGDQSHE